MANVLDNAVTMVVLLFFAIGMYAAFSVVSSIEGGSYAIINQTLSQSQNATGIPMTDKLYMVEYYHDMGNNVMQICKDAYDMIIIITSCFICWSSLVRRYDFGSFLLYFVASIMVSGLSYFIFASVFNLMTSGLALTYSAVVNFYAQNILYVMLLNIIFFCGAWIFSLRAGKTQGGY